MNIHQHEAVYDVIVVGGSHAGLSAAMQLARARRRVLVLDTGQRRNRYAEHSHGFLTQDGSAAAGIAARGRAQLEAYPTVQWRDEGAVSAAEFGDGFQLTLSDGDAVLRRRLVLATGVIDELPPIAGLAERWGRSVFHCPYCHGYELDQGNIGVLATSAMAMHHALMLPDWGRVTLLLNDAFDPDGAQLAALERRGVRLERSAVVRVEGTADVVLANGLTLPMDGLFVMSQMRAASGLADQLGCAMDDGAVGKFIRTDAQKASSVRGVFCCGDMARAVGNVAMAVADGALAGVAAHRSLIAELETM